MSDETQRLDALRRAMQDLAAAQRARADAFARTAGPLADDAARGLLRAQAEDEVEAARERLRKARDALGARVTEEKAWGGH